MKINIKIIILILVLPGFLSAQLTLDREVLAAGGDFSNNASLQVSWTLGEPAIAYSQTSGLLVTEGFQQSDLISTAVDEIPFAGSFNVYPNHVEHSLYFEISTDNEVTLRAELFDLNGRKIMEIQDFSVQSEYRGMIDFSQLAAGKTFLRFLDDKGDAVKVFTIVKVK